MTTIADETAAEFASVRAQAKIAASRQEIDSLFSVAESLAHLVAGNAQGAADALTRSLVHSDNARRLRAVAG